jgi:hypothetical protein
MMPKAEALSIPRPEELDKFLEELEPVVSESQYGMACTLVGLVRRIANELERARVSLTRLRNVVFGGSQDKTGPLDEVKKAAAEDSASKRLPRGNPKGKGHGRNSLKRGFWGAVRHLVLHAQLTSGSLCGTDCSGRLNVLNRVRSTARIFGQAFLPMHIWEQQGLRCSACQRIAWAPLPPEAKGPKYDPTAVSMLAGMVYANGLPLTRIARHQEGCGVPIPETVQCELLAGLAEQVEPVHEVLIDRAAQAELFHLDDTTRKILSLPAGHGADESAAADGVCGQEKKNKKERTGTFTTAIVSVGEGRRIVLFFTGRRHAGENLQELLRRRSRHCRKPIQMSDALPCNVPVEFDTVVANCLSHGRSKVKDLLRVFPEPVRHVLEEVAKVYRVDARARREQLSDAERLKLHREESLPVMETLCGWMEAQFAQKAVEPNSSLGMAFHYWLNHWYQLTQFTRVPGVPIDNNLAERVLKMAIRHRKNSLFYKTPHGAAVGDRLMSLLFTCQLAGIDPFGYLTALQRHREAVAAEPEAWLPWNYEQAVATASAPTAPETSAKTQAPVHNATQREAQDEAPPATPVQASQAAGSEGALADADASPTPEDPTESAAQAATLSATGGAPLDSPAPASMATAPKTSMETPIPASRRPTPEAPTPVSDANQTADDAGASPPCAATASATQRGLTDSSASASTATAPRVPVQTPVPASGRETPGQPSSAPRTYEAIENAHETTVQTAGSTGASRRQRRRRPAQLPSPVTQQPPESPSRRRDAHSWPPSTSPP